MEKRNSWYRYWMALLAILLVVGLAGCGILDGLTGEKEPESEREDTAEDAYDPDFPVTAAGITLQAKPGRVVSLSPSITEKMFDLGMDDRLVGISDYCDYPTGISSLPVCGTPQEPDMEAIVGLQPSLILTEVGLEADMVAQLAQERIPVAILHRAASVDELSENYIELAKLMQGSVTGVSLGAATADEFRGGLNELNGVMREYTEENGRKKILYLRLMDYVMATGDTFEQELFSVACMDNVAADQTGWEYPEEDASSPEGQEAFRTVDFIFIDGDFITISEMESHPFYGTLPAVKEDRYFYVSSLLLERQSLRTLKAIEQMAAYVYPDAGARTDTEYGEDDLLNAWEGSGEE